MVPWPVDFRKGSRVGTLRLQDEEGQFRWAQEEGQRTTLPLIELGQACPMVPGIAARASCH